MRGISKILIPLTVVLFLAGCTADVEDEGNLPDVDVSGGELPEVDVDPARVEVSTDTQMVEVPDVDVESTDQQ